MPSTIENGIVITLDRVDEITKLVLALTKTQVMVGIPSSTAGRKDGPISNAALGYIHEYGSPARKIPARPFLGPAVTSMADEAAKMLAIAANFALAGEPQKAEQAFNALGLKAQSVVKAKIVSGPFAPNADSTIAAKGSDSPLIGITGQLLNSITYVVRKS